jgi:hypothetical protein
MASNSEPPIPDHAGFLEPDKFGIFAPCKKCKKIMEDCQLYDPNKKKYIHLCVCLSCMEQSEEAVELVLRPLNQNPLLEYHFRQEIQARMAEKEVQRGLELNARMKVMMEKLSHNTPK